MAIRLRVYPQPGSTGALRNQVARKNQQIANKNATIRNLRQQVQLLRNQLAGTQGTMLGAGLTGNYGLGSARLSPFGLQSGFGTSLPTLTGASSLGGYPLGGYNNFGGFGTQFGGFGNSSLLGNGFGQSGFFSGSWF